MVVVFADFTVCKVANVDFTVWFDWMKAAEIDFLDSFSEKKILRIFYENLRNDFRYNRVMVRDISLVSRCKYIYHDYFSKSFSTLV